MLAKNIWFDIYAKLSWFHLNEIDVPIGSIANNNVLWNRHIISLFGSAVSSGDVGNKKEEFMKYIDVYLKLSSKMLFDKLKNDYWYVFLRVNEDGCFLAYASDKLKQNLKIVSAALKQDPSAFRYVDNTLKIKNWDFIFGAIKCDSYECEYIPDILLQYRESVVSVA
jgi:Domain of unknown function (DUF4116)